MTQNIVPRVAGVMKNQDEISVQPSVFFRLRSWFIGDSLGIIRKMRLSYIPPLMVYFAAGL